MTTDDTTLALSAGDGTLQLGSLPAADPKQLVKTATEIAGELARIIADRLSARA